jgi:hypothetical protein
MVSAAAPSAPGVRDEAGMVVEYWPVLQRSRHSLTIKRPTCWENETTTERAIVVALVTIGLAAADCA